MKGGEDQLFKEVCKQGGDEESPDHLVLMTSFHKAPKMISQSMYTYLQEPP